MVNVRVLVALWLNWEHNLLIVLQKGLREPLNTAGDSGKVCVNPKSVRGGSTDNP